MSTDDYPSDWNARRKKVYQRDGHKCQNCGTFGGPKGNAELHAHHVVPKSKGGTHETTNLITICKECHDAIHGNKNAPTKDSSRDSSPGHIRDIRGFLETRDQYVDARDLMSGILTIPKENLQDCSDYEIMKKRNGYIGNIKDTREILTKCRFKLRNMDMDYEKMANNTNLENPSELRTIIGRLSDLMIEDIEILLQGTNISEEYIEVISSAECQNCGNRADHEDSFCGECGEEIPDIWACKECGKSIESSRQNFCKSCGSDVTTFSEIQKTKLNSLRNKSDKIADQADNLVEDIDSAFVDFTELAS